MVDLIQKYNIKLQRRTTEFKQTNSEKHEEMYKVEENFTNNTYQVGIGLDTVVHQQFVLNVISYFHSQNLELKGLVTLKHQLNNNSVKMGLYREVIEGSDAKREERLSVQTATFGELSKDVLTEETEDPEVDTLREELKVVSEETTRLQLDLKNLGTRTQMLEKELKKNKDFARLNKDDGLEKKVVDLEQQIKEIQEEINLFSQ